MKMVSLEVVNMAPHLLTHKGKGYKQGDKITVSEHEAAGMLLMNPMYLKVCKGAADAPDADDGLKAVAKNRSMAGKGKARAKA
jgi:hypothetical protein